jgi:hypothetical protein
VYSLQGALVLHAQRVDALNALQDVTYRSTRSVWNQLLLLHGLPEIAVLLALFHRSFRLTF